MRKVKKTTDGGDMRKILLLVMFLAFSLILQAKTLKVVLDDNYPPYSFFGSSGKPMGICVDLWKKWEEVTGVKVDLIFTNWENAIPMVEHEKADVVDEIFYTAKRAKELDFTRPYDTVKTRIFFDKRLSGITNDIATLKGFDIGVKSGDYDAAYLAEHGIRKLSYYPSYSSLVRAAKEGNVHIFVMDDPCAFYYLSKYGILRDFRYTKPLFVSKLYRAVKKGNEETLNLVEKGFSEIPRAYVESVMNKWKGQMFVSNVWQEWWLLAVVALIVGGITVVFFVWNRVLSLMVKKKTKQLEEERIKLEEEKKKLKKEMEKSMESKERAAELSERLNEVTQHLYELNEKMMKIVKLISEFSPFSDEKEFAKNILDLALRFIPEADGGSVSIVEDDKWKYLALVGDYDIEKLMGLNLKAEWMLRTDKVEVIDRIIDRDKDLMPPEVLEAFKKYSKRRIFRSIVAPIQINGKYTGNIFLDAYEDVDFSPESKHLMEMLGNLSSAFFTIKRINTIELEHQRELLREIVVLVESSIPNVRGHSERVATLCESIGKKMGLSTNDTKDLKWCGILHDIGFVGISSDIHKKLADPNGFSEDESDILKTHSVLGEFILSFSTLPKRYAVVIRAHHENYDGTGYPDGLKGEDIPLFSRIIMVVNAFDEMVNIRKEDPKFALEKIKSGSGTLYDPQVVKSALKVFSEFISKLRPR